MSTTTTEIQTTTTEEPPTVPTTTTTTANPDTTTELPATTTTRSRRTRASTSTVVVTSDGTPTTIVYTVIITESDVSTTAAPTNSADAIQTSTPSPTPSGLSSSAAWGIGVGAAIFVASVILIYVFRKWKLKVASSFRRQSQINDCSRLGDSSSDSLAMTSRLCSPTCLLRRPPPTAPQTANSSVSSTSLNSCVAVHIPILCILNLVNSNCFCITLKYQLLNYILNV